MSSSGVLPELIDNLAAVFRGASHKRAAHHLAGPLLEQASREPRLITEALGRFLASPASCHNLNYPVATLPLATHPYFELVINCWSPLPDRETDLTTKAVHHHGDMLLSTATIFGPGYEHWLFTRPRPATGEAAQGNPLLHTMTPVEVRRHD